MSNEECPEELLVRIGKELDLEFSGFVLIAVLTDRNGKVDRHLVNYSGGIARAMGLCDVGRIKLGNRVADAFQAEEGNRDSSEGEDVE